MEALLFNPLVQLSLGYLAVFFALVAAYRFSKTARRGYHWLAKDSDCEHDPFAAFLLWPGVFIFIMIGCVGIALGKTLGWIGEKLIPRDIIK